VSDLRALVHDGRVFLDSVRGREQVYAFSLDTFNGGSAYCVPLTHRDRVSPTGESLSVAARLARQTYRVNLRDLLIDPLLPPPVSELDHPVPCGSLLHDRQNGITDSVCYFVDTASPCGFIYRSDIFHRFTSLSDGSRLQISRALRGDVITVSFGRPLQGVRETLDLRRIL
jgi:hypothetical protein